MIDNKSGTKRKGVPSKEEILATWWGPLEQKNRKDLLGKKTNGRLTIPPDTDRCWLCHSLENHSWYPYIGNIERCHIVPVSLGGNNDPMNFLLLCSRCHRKSPDVKIPDLMFKWLEEESDKQEEDKREWMEECLKTFKPEFDGKNATEMLPIFVKIFAVRNTKGFQQFYSKNASSHFGVHHKWSTFFSLLREYMNRRPKKLKKIA